MITHKKFNQLIKLIIGLIFGVWFIWVLTKNIAIIYSPTDSLAKHYFLHLKKLKPKLNDYTLVYSPWYKGLVIKQIVGVSQDRIWYNQQGVLLINSHIIGKPKPIATDGRVLHPIESQIIPRETVFLKGDHIDSFDSRYQEFGLVAVDCLEGLVIPLK